MARNKPRLSPERYVDTATLAAALGLPLRTFWRRLRDGTIPRPTHPGRPHRFDLRALVALTERSDPWLSCRLAGQAARIRAEAAQRRRLWGDRWRTWTDEAGTEWQSPASHSPIAPFADG